MSVHQEIAFEGDICAHLAAHGWRYEPGDAQRYDRARALFPPDLIAWVQETQPAAWASLTKTHGAATETVLLDRIRKQLDDCGTLDLLRHGVELLGLRKPLQLAQFRPALAMNPALEARYQAKSRSGRSSINACCRCWSSGGRAEGSTCRRMNAIIDAFAAHGTMSQQALDSERVRRGLQDSLLGPGQIWEALRERDDAPA